MGLPGVIALLITQPGFNMDDFLFFFEHLNVSSRAILGHGHTGPPVVVQSVKTCIFGVPPDQNAWGPVL